MGKQVGLPPKQGLYDPQFEKDACGVGFVANISGAKSHEIISKGITVLANLEHRGATGSDAHTGDGAGVLIQLPHRFMLKAAAAAGLGQLPEEGQYGVGMVFMPPTEALIAPLQTLIEEAIKDEGLQLIGWRIVPTDNSVIGDLAKESEPKVYQVFVGQLKDKQPLERMALERKLYVLRKVIEQRLRECKLQGAEQCYFPSLSCNTIVYKGLLTPQQIPVYYSDLNDPDLESAMALVHQRYSTNTFPTWERAHPYRYIAHNGEINTLKGNSNWMNARQAHFVSELLGEDVKKLYPVVTPGGSDSAAFDNVLELLVMAGRDIEHSMMMMVPETWETNPNMDDDKKAFYEFHQSLIEPWDGPAAISFTNGKVIGAILDRNGLRPGRYVVTKDGFVVMASETGVLNIPVENIERKGRLEPGKMFLVNLEEGRIIEDEEVKKRVVSRNPYREWLNQHKLSLRDLPPPPNAYQFQHHTTTNLTQRQQAFSYTVEELRVILTPMAANGEEAVGSMGNDTPLAVLSERPQLLYNYFKQLFAQVTNPPIDPIREDVVMSTSSSVGSEENLLAESPLHCRQLRIEQPVLTNYQLEQIRHIEQPGFKTKTLSMLYRAKDGGKGLEEALDQLCQEADQAILEGYNILILSDRGISGDLAPIPALLATGAVHHHLIREKTRTRCGLIVESGEPREVQHFALLISYGASAVNPYLAIETMEDMYAQQMLPEGLNHKDIEKNYMKAVNKGLLKIFSKMGISTFQSYQGAQIFEIIGLHDAVVEKYFTGTASRVSGIGLDEIALEIKRHHEHAFEPKPHTTAHLYRGGQYQWRKNGEHHFFNPETVAKLQHATASGNYNLFKKYTAIVNNEAEKLSTLRGLLKFKKGNPIPIEEVEPAENIFKRFCTGAMSYGSISKEAHETLAIAMNRIGGKSNTGEGGEDPARFIPDANGDWRRSAIKQVASGRFGVNSHYLVNASEIQIKMAQGAKPGEGGQLPGHKVDEYIARVRNSVPGVTLISPPPHHDIYSIEDLAQLIWDLKNVNPQADISVKLVAEVGVGTVAAGVAKAHADGILISGHDGGTGASPLTSIKHAGIPWEIGLAEAHQVLLMNGLRSRVRLQTDGQLKTGRDVVIATLLGAEEYGFATAPLVTMGCILMRKCHLNTCPVGIATQDGRLREKFAGKPEFVVNFFKFIAQEVRELMAELGFRTVDEMVGRVDLLEMDTAIGHYKAQGLDLSPILYQPEVGPEVKRYYSEKQNHGLEKALDHKIIDEAYPALEHGRPVEIEMEIKNSHRTVGAMLGGEISKRYGAEGLPDGTIRLNLKGNAGQSFGAFVPNGVTLNLEGDANDYVGKGLCGGRIIVKTPAGATFDPRRNIIIGNTTLYGAINGEAYFNGVAGERFAVRNSGASAVVEGVGDHGCEYMTGGRVVVLGRTGRNFGAGMSGGIAYVLDEDGQFHQRYNLGMVDLEKVTGPEDVKELQALIEKHYQYTGSQIAEQILLNWSSYQGRFVKVMPREYKRVLGQLQQKEMVAKHG
jgi:glutamate synthase domain-containing protein 2/glutamate synthase domain-containing protein 1/glutamate synthase domain-containing protein 3